MKFPARLPVLLVSAICLLGRSTHAQPIAIPLAYGTNLTCVISNLGQHLLFSFEARSGDPVRVQGSDGTPWNAFGVWIEVSDSSGHIWTSGLDATLARVEFVALTTGVHTLLVRDPTDSGVGQCGLSLQRTRQPGAAVALQYGGNLNGSIPVLGGIAAYTFMGEANDPVVIRVSDGTSWNEFTPQVQIYGPNGQSLTSTNGGALAEAFFKVTEAGLHTILVTDTSAFAVGAFGLNLQRTINPGQSVLLHYGDILNGSIPSLGGSLAYRFSAQAGDSIGLRAGDESSWNTLDPHIRVFDTLGHLVASAAGSASAGLSFLATNTGNYYVLVSDLEADGTGGYTVSLSRTNQDLPVVFNFLASTNLLQRAGGTVQFTATARASNGVSTVLLTIVAPDGELVQTNLLRASGDDLTGTWWTSYAFPSNASPTTQVYQAWVSVTSATGHSTNTSPLTMQVLNYVFDELRIKKAGVVVWEAIAGQYYAFSGTDLQGAPQHPLTLFRASADGVTHYFLDDFAWPTCAVEGVTDVRVGTLQVGSSSCASFALNGTNFYHRCGYALNAGRGFSFAILDPVSKEILEVRAFDTWISYEAWKDMAEYVAAIPAGRLVLVATGDDIGYYAHGLQPYVEKGFQALHDLGSKRIREYYFRDSWGLIAIKGATNALAEGFQTGYGLEMEWRFAVPPTQAVPFQAAPAARLEWHSFPRRSYVVQHGGDLQNWMDVSNPLATTNGLLAYYHLWPQPVVPVSFFRLRIAPPLDE